MTRSLYTKFLLGYLVFGLLGFIFIATMSSEITYQYLLEEKSESLYDEANLLASTYSDIYQGKNISLSTANPQLQAVATYLKAQAWVINQKGRAEFAMIGPSQRTKERGNRYENQAQFRSGGRGHHP